MTDLWRAGRSAAVVVTAVLAAVGLAGPTVAGAGTFATTATPPGKQAKEPGPGKAKAGVREGIVQRVSPTAIVLRELDGSTVTVRVGSTTNVFVDGKRATLHDVKAGFVASAKWKPGKPARVLQTFDLSGPHAVSVGVVDSVSPDAVDVTLTGGATVSIPVNSETRVFVDGRRATFAAVKAGYTAVMSAKDSKGDRPAHELRFLRPV